MKFTKSILTTIAAATLMGTAAGATGFDNPRAAQQELRLTLQQSLSERMQQLLCERFSLRCENGQPILTLPSCDGQTDNAAPQKPALGEVEQPDSSNHQDSADEVQQPAQSQPAD